MASSTESRTRITNVKGLETELLSTATVSQATASSSSWRITPVQAESVIGRRGGGLSWRHESTISNTREGALSRVNGPPSATTGRFRRWNCGPAPARGERAARRGVTLKSPREQTNRRNGSAIIAMSR